MLRIQDGPPPPGPPNPPKHNCKGMLNDIQKVTLLNKEVVRLSLSLSLALAVAFVSSLCWFYPLHHTGQPRSFFVIVLLLVPNHAA